MQITRSMRAPAAFSRSMAATALPPVASIGSIIEHEAVGEIAWKLA